MKEIKKIIVTILAFESNESELKKQLSNPEMDWSLLVKVSSQLGVMTSVFCRLKQKQLTNYLPEDLNIYFEEITEINRNRNQTLLNQTIEISSLFDKHKISHVFIKGVALLAMECYKDLGERLIGDIDVLIDPAQIYKAKQLLLQCDYVSTEFTLFGKHKKHRHLPRLIHPERIGAVEIHSQILRKKIKNFLKPNEVITSSKVINTIRVPNNQTLIDILILSSQINDFGYLYKTINYKACYDSLVIEQFYSSEINWDASKYHRLFHDLITLYLNPISNSKSLRSFIKNQFYKHLNKPSLFRRLYSKLISWFLKLLQTLKGMELFIKNNEFRSDVLNNMSQFRAYLNKKN
jgi:hypothetical protein|tara:strand:- start:904 stop:1950 length:1047 start_codon:yes stop_codon:yes gene_type:complete